MLYTEIYDINSEFRVNHFPKPPDYLTSVNVRVNHINLLRRFAYMNPPHFRTLFQVFPRNLFPVLQPSDTEAAWGRDR